MKVPGSSVSPTRRCLLSWSLGCVLPPADPLLPGSVRRDSPRRTRAPVALLRAGSAFLIPALSPSSGQKRRLDGAKPADRHRVRAALRAFGQRRLRVDLRPAALRRVWGLRRSGDSRRVRTAAKQLRRKLGDDANNPTYILNEPSVRYRMAKGAATGPETGP